MFADPWLVLKKMRRKINISSVLLPSFKTISSKPMFLVLNDDTTDNYQSSSGVLLQPMILGLFTPSDNSPEYNSKASFFSGKCQICGSIGTGHNKNMLMDTSNICYLVVFVAAY